MRVLVRAVFVIVLLWLAGSLQLATAANNENVARALKAIATSGQLKLEDPEGNERLFQILTFYEGRNFKPIWTRDSGAKSKARHMLLILRSAAAQGLEPAHYAIDQIEERIDSEDPGVLAVLDILLSQTFTRFARDLSKGRVVPSQVDNELHIVPNVPGPLSLIEAAEVADDMRDHILTLLPRSSRYGRLVAALERYRKIAADGGWPKIPAGEKILPGGDDPRIPAIRLMLGVMGDLAPQTSGTGTVYDEPLNLAVKSFQVRHGLIPHGMIDAGTQRAMNVTVEQRIGQLIVNMERRRWDDGALAETHVLVNGADQYLKLVRGGKTVFTALVVVGRPTNRTPVFTANVEQVVINPVWQMPADVADAELLPALQRSPSVLKERRLTLYDGERKVNARAVDWSKLEKLPYVVRQAAHPANPLGPLEFRMPNGYGIGLHGARGGGQFLKEQRFFSSGSMRVESPGELALALLDDQGWTKEKIAGVIRSQKEKVIALEAPVPIYVTYYTAWVNKDRSVHFRDDVYGRDRRLADALR